jgi:hypothetical protein
MLGCRRCVGGTLTVGVLDSAFAVLDETRMVKLSFEL